MNPIFLIALISTKSTIYCAVERQVYMHTTLHAHQEAAGERVDKLMLVRVRRVLREQLPQQQLRTSTGTSTVFLSES